MTRLDNDLISRKALLEVLRDYGHFSQDDYVIEAVSLLPTITNAPTVEQDSEPVLKLWESIGRWSKYLSSNGKDANLSPPDWLVDAVKNATSPPKQDSEPIALLALKNTVLNKRIEVLEDLLSSAAVIALRRGSDTHWDRFIGQLKINGICFVTPKTFKILPSDDEYTSPPKRELADKQIAELQAQLAEQIKECQRLNKLLEE